MAGIAPEPEPDEVEGGTRRNPRASAARGSRRSPERSSKPARRARKWRSTVAADGSVSLQFGELQTDQTNDLDKWMAKRYAN